MAGSQSVATATALRALGRTVDQTVVIAGVPDGSPSTGVLEADDVLVTRRRRPRDLGGCRARGRPAARAGRHLPRRRAPRRGGAHRHRPHRRVRRPHRAWGSGCGSTTTCRSTSRCAPAASAGPSAGLMFSLAIYDVADPGRAHRRQEHRRHRDDGRRRRGRADRRHPAEARRGPRAGADFFLAPADNCDEVVGNVPDGLRVVRVATFDEGGRRRRGTSRTGNGGTPSPTCGLDARAGPWTPQSWPKVARSACTSPGAMSSPRATRSSLSWSRWRSRQRADPSRVTATSSRTSARPGCSATARRAVGVVLGQLALGLRRHDDPLDGQRAPRDLLGPGDPGEQVLEARGLGQLLLLDGARAPPRPRRGSPGPSASCGSCASRSAVGTRANSRTGWSHPARATWRSVSRAARVSGSVTGWGVSVTAPWCPMGAQVAGVHCSPTVDTGDPPTAGRGEQ